MPDESGPGYEVASAYVTLLPEDEGFAEAVQAMIEEGVGSAAENVSATLSERLEQGISSGAEAGGEELSGQIERSADEGATAAAEAITERLTAGAGEAAEQVSAALNEGLEAAGESAGESFSASFAEQTASEIPEQMRAVGTEAGAALDAGLEAATAGIGAEMAAQIAYELETGLRSAGASTVMDFLEQGMLDGFSTETAGWMQDLTEGLNSGILSPDELFASEGDAIDAMFQRQSEQAQQEGQSSGEAFVRAFDQSVTQGIGDFGSLADQGVLASSFASLGEQAGHEFAVEYSAQVEEALNAAEIGGGFSEGAAAGEGGTGDLASTLEGVSASTYSPVELGSLAQSKTAKAAAGGLMGGPLGMVLWQLPWLLTSLPSLFGGGSTTNPAITAITSAIQQAGGNTTSTATSSVQSSINNNGALTALEKQTGLSATNLIEAAIGIPGAQSQLASGYAAAQAQDQQGAGYNQPSIPGRGSATPNEQQVNLQQLEQAHAAYMQIANSVADAMNAQAQLNEQTEILDGTTQVLNANLKQSYAQMALQAEQSAITTAATMNLGAGMDAENAQLVHVISSYNVAQQQATAYASALDAMNNTSNSTVGALNNDSEYMSIFNRVMADNVQAMQLSAQHSAQTSVAALQLGSSQGQLNFQLTQAETAYTEATTGASAYTAALTAQSGSATSLLNTQAAFTISLNNLTTAVGSYGTSLDATTLDGAQNIQVMTGISSAADAQATALYQSEVGTKGASQAYQDANSLLAQEEQAFVTAAEKAGYNAQEVQQLANQLYQLPPAIQAASGTVNINTQQAQSNLSALDQQLNTVALQIDTLNAASGGSSAATVARPGTPRAAQGAIAQAGFPVVVGDAHRAELFVPETNGTIYPSVQEGMDALGGSGRPVGGVTLNYYGSQLPTPEEHAQMMRDLATVGALG